MRLIIVFICFVLVGCERSEPNGFYKYYSEYHIGDYLNIPSDIHCVRNDTIFISQIPKAIFLGTERRLDGNEILEIKSLASGEIGRYIKK